MNTEASTSELPEAPAAGASTDAGSLGQQGMDMLRELRSVAYDHLQLAGLEAQRASRSLVAMIAAAVLLGLLLASAGLMLSGAFVFALTALGLPASLALLSAALVNLFVAALVVARIRAHRQWLGFPASLRNLKPEARPASAEAPAS